MLITKLKLGTNPPVKLFYGPAELRILVETLLNPAHSLGGDFTDVRKFRQ